MLFKCASPYIKHPSADLRAILVNKTAFMVETYQVERPSNQEKRSMPLSSRLEAENELKSITTDFVSCYYPSVCECTCSKATNEDRSCSCTKMPAWYCGVSDMTDITDEGMCACTYLWRWWFVFSRARADSGSHFVTRGPHDPWPMTQSQTMAWVDHGYLRIMMSSRPLPSIFYNSMQ